MLCISPYETFNKCSLPNLFRKQNRGGCITPGGPTTATTTGGGSSGVRSTIGTCSLFSDI